jgi:NAD(P)-dependent dehydrogenase (short-subunit alcohol dehydrogenase family)
MAVSVDVEKLRFSEAITAGVRGRRVLITGAGRQGGLGQAVAVAAGLGGAETVAVHFHRSYDDGLETVELIEKSGGSAFPVQADVTNLSDVWSIRSYISRKMGGRLPDLIICNSGLSESGYPFGRAPREQEGESAAMRRARARQAFMDNLNESKSVVDTKIDGFLAMTHLWAGEALHAGQPIEIVYVSSRQATDPGAGVPGYVVANWGVLVLPKTLRINAGARGEGLLTAFSVTLPFVRTGMTEAYAGNRKVFGRWQPRMLETHEAAQAVLELLARPAAELNEGIFQLNVGPQEGGPDGAVSVTWSQVELKLHEQQLGWSESEPMVFQAPQG